MLVLPFDRSTRCVDREKCFDLQTLVSFSLSSSLSVEVGSLFNESYKFSRFTRTTGRRCLKFLVFRDILGKAVGSREIQRSDSMPNAKNIEINSAPIRCAAIAAGNETRSNSRRESYLLVFSDLEWPANAIGPCFPRCLLDSQIPPFAGAHNDQDCETPLWCTDNLGVRAARKLYRKEKSA